MSRKSRSRSSSTAPAEPLACPNCARRYGSEERFCRHCGMPLVHAGPATVEVPRDRAHEQARKIRPEFTRGDVVRVGWGRNQAEAELIQNILLEEGVPSILRRSGGADVPDFLAAGPRDVLVPASGVSAAREALHQAEIEPVQPRESASGRQAARIATGVLGGAGLAALIAWLLVHAVK